MTLFRQGSTQIGYFFALEELWGISLVVAILLFFTFRPKACFVGEQRLELATPLWQKMLMILLGALLLVTFVTMWFSALPANDVDMTVLLHYLAMGCAAFGILRYAQCERFIAFMGAFTLLSLPALVFHVIREDSSTYVLSGVWTLLMFSCLANWVGYCERRQMLLVALSAFVLLTKFSVAEYGVLSVILVGVLLLVVILFKVGWHWLLLVTGIMAGLGYLIVTQGLLGDATTVTDTITQVQALAKDVAVKTALPTALPSTLDMRLRDLIQLLFVQNHWHILFYTMPLCVCFWVFYPIFNKGKTYRVAMVYVVSGLCSLLCVLTYVLLDVARFPEIETALNHCIFIIAPLLALMPALTYEACRVKPRLG